MAKHIITTPNKDFNDERIGVRFRNGIGETDNTEVAKRMKHDYGYEVTGLTDATKDAGEPLNGGSKSKK